MRVSAQERRQDVLQAAITEFAVGGLVGTATETIARRAGISQPYVFRLFPTKKALFLAAVESAFDQVEHAFVDAAEGTSGEQTITAMSEAYQRLLVEHQTCLQLQMQAYASSVADAEVRELTQRAFDRLWSTAATLSGLGQASIQAFFASVMLLNLRASIDPPKRLTDRLGRRPSVQH